MSDNGLSPVWHQAIIWSNGGLLSIGSLATNFSEILTKIQNFSFTKMHLKILSAKRRPFCPGGDKLTIWHGSWFWACRTAHVHTADFFFLLPKNSSLLFTEANSLVWGDMCPIYMQVMVIYSHYTLLEVAGMQPIGAVENKMLVCGWGSHKEIQ